MSIPFVFYPHQYFVKNKNGEIVVYHLKTNQYYSDGGILDNYPIWLFDNEKVFKFFFKIFKILFTLLVFRKK
jgi:predicted acylesterase/phospholipase RssA